MVLLLVAVCAALAMVLSALTERSPALPVSTAVWCVLLGFLAVIAAIVRALERPDHATAVCVGAWLALAGAVAILAGAWQALRDERPSLYEPATPDRSKIGQPPGLSGRAALPSARRYICAGLTGEARNLAPTDAISGR